jgi:phosphoglycerol transferase MdoB-like AlkP superfamily enzyme
MRKKINMEEAQREREKRRLLFVSLGLRPLQVILCISFFVYVFSIISPVGYYWSQVHLLGVLIPPALLFLVWFLHFQYSRICFLLLACAIGGSLLSSLGHHAVDDFSVVNLVAQFTVLVIAIVIYAKMKDPAFSKTDKV